MTFHKKYRDAMERRRFLLYLSSLCFGVGGLTYLLSNRNDRFFNTSPLVAQDSETLDKFAFIQTVFPLHAMDKMLTYEDHIHATGEEWVIIEKTFFQYYYSRNQKKFHTRDSEDREVYISAFQTGPQSNSEYHYAKKTIMKHFLHHSPFLFEAYGYPAQKAMPFYADPSWDRYHLRP